ncbi:calmodulin-4-like [Tigriopus californicus]|uniref:calmodulin-4-like n=1 Tax=Tigriopus californicus TaxID=6832 RepID=UPI0027D9D391|nr:calmodulin-4-like [Tigriopus californicus]
MSGAMFLMLKKSSDRRQREALEEAFKRADVNGDGRLSVDEYYQILKEHGIECNREEIIQIMQIADKDHDGFISKEEFLGDSPKPDGVSKARRAFNVFDKNHDGFVTKEEMMKMSKHITKEQVDAVFARNDGNHDGKLTLNEFQEFMDHNRPSKK